MDWVPDPKQLIGTAILLLGPRKRRTDSSSGTCDGSALLQSHGAKHIGLWAKKAKDRLFQRHVQWFGLPSKLWRETNFFLKMDLNLTLQDSHNLTILKKISGSGIYLTTMVSTVTVIAIITTTG